MEIAQGLDASAWQRLSAGGGTKGARLHDWASCELADLDAAEYDSQQSGLWTRGLLIRRTVADGDLAFFSTWRPARTSIDTLVKVEGHRWAIEDSFETATNSGSTTTRAAPGTDGIAIVSLVMLAFAINGREHGAAPANQTQDLAVAPPLIRWSIWRRAHQAVAKRAHLKLKMQL